MLDKHVLKYFDELPPPQKEMVWNIENQKIK